MTLSLSDIKLMIYLIDQSPEPEKYQQLQKRLEDQLVKLTS